MNWYDMDVPCDRYEMAALIWGAVNRIGMGIVTPKFTGSNSIPDWSSIPEKFQQPVADCVRMGLIQGMDSAGTFIGEGTVTRAQAAAIMNRAIDWCAQENQIPQLFTKEQLSLMSCVPCMGGYHVDPRLTGDDMIAFPSFSFSGDWSSVTFTLTADYEVPTEFVVELWNDISKFVLQPGESRVMTIDLSETDFCQIKLGPIGMSDYYEDPYARVPEFWITDIRVD